MTECAKQDLIVVTDKGEYTLLVINRPEKRNAMNREMRLALLEAMERIRGSSSVVVLTGAEKAFCSGVDIKEIAQDRAEGRTEDPKSDWNEVNLAIRQHPAIFIAAVNGLALGGGSTLISVCDLAIASEEAEIGMPEMAMGIFPALAGPAGLLAINRKRAAWMILTAKRISGRQAMDWGLVNQCVPGGQLMDAADELARHIGRFDPIALTESKRAMDVIPNQISEWRQAFNYGVQVNHGVRMKTNWVNPSIVRNKSERHG